MIAFDLQCSNGHVFEGWFEDGNAYVTQKKKNLILCPACNDATVSKVPSTFGVVKSSRQTAREPQNANLNILQPEFETFKKTVINFVEKNSDDVGCDFAKEALKIHYGASEPRNIRGISTTDEEKMLQDEGIQFFKVPVPAKPDYDA